LVVANLVPAGGEGMGICGAFPEFAGFWEDPSETVIDPESVAAMADDWA